MLKLIAIFISTIMTVCHCQAKLHVFQTIIRYDLSDERVSGKHKGLRCISLVDGESDHKCQINFVHGPKITDKNYKYLCTSQLTVLHHDQTKPAHTRGRLTPQNNLACQIYSYIKSKITIYRVGYAK